MGFRKFLKNAVVDVLEGAVNILEEISERKTRGPSSDEDDEVLEPPTTLEHATIEWDKSVTQNGTLDLVGEPAGERKGHATEERFRLIDCYAYALDNILRIVEFSTPRDELDPSYLEDSVLKKVGYTALSYPWRGNHQPPNHRSFSVTLPPLPEGERAPDRIDANVFLTLCQASLGLGFRYMWMDRLCMIQTSKRDKSWQIKRMASIYKRCNRCLVLPGGLGGFVGFGDVTLWIYRSWTLQEALLPQEVWVLFKWSHGDGQWDDEINVIEKPYGSGVAMSALSAVLRICTRGDTYFIPDGKSFSAAIPISGKLFCEEVEPINALLAAMKGKGDESSRQMAIWRCALMRTSQREEDVVYSIMGLFGVSLDPKKYENKTEALIALCQGILRNGGSPQWIAASMTSPAANKVCTMPMTPVSTGIGAPVIRLTDGREEPGFRMVSDLNWYLVHIPKGEMDNDGFLHLTAPISTIKIDSVQSPPPSDEDDSEEVTCVPGFDKIATARRAGGRPIRFYGISGETGVDSGPTHAVMIGRTLEYVHFDPDTDYEGRKIGGAILMLLRLKGPNIYHKTGMAIVKPEELSGWSSANIAVGGAEK